MLWLSPDVSDNLHFDIMWILIFGVLVLTSFVKFALGLAWTWCNATILVGSIPSLVKRLQVQGYFNNTAVKCSNMSPLKVKCSNM